jgi:hypothetical protein
LKILASDTLKFSKLTWQKEGDGLAFLKSYKKDRYEEENAVVYSYTDIYKTPVLKTFDPETAKGFPAGMHISNKAAVSMSDDMTSVFFALDKWTYNAPPKKDSVKTDSSKSTVAVKKENPPPKTANVDVWHWKDPEIPATSENDTGTRYSRGYLSVWNTG